MMREQLSSTLNIEGTEIPFHQIHQQFAHTLYGSALSEQVRYERYKPSRITNQEWTNALGADVNNLLHMPLTYGLTRHFIRYCHQPPADWPGETNEAIQFTNEEQELLLLTAMVHDQGEAIVQDITYDLKTIAHETEEIQAFRDIIDVMPIAAQEAYREKVTVALHDVLHNRSSKLGRAFNAVERVGYLRTGVRAFELSTETYDPEMQQGLQWLANNVLLNQIPTLVGYADIYPPIYQYLNENGDRITRSFRNMPLIAFNGYTDDKLEKAQSYLAAYDTWIAYQQQNGTST